MENPDEEEGEEEEPEPEPTPEEKIAALKEALQEGELGPAQFDSQFQAVWMQLKAQEGISLAEAHGLRRGVRPSVQSDT